MENNACIRIWTRDDVPERFRDLVPREEVGGMIAMFLAHVPAAILAGETYRLCNEPSGTEGWMREGDLGFFGINALNTFPHPDGDGILIVGSCV